ncbi:hypothetical protein KCP77_18510 [Salmonella enterica subsp. enterica]|nr:hypothetical protein KCP77_18510 [Salmonella enterica subsp. enterica]
MRSESNRVSHSERGRVVAGGRESYCTAARRTVGNWQHDLYMATALRSLPRRGSGSLPAEQSSGVSSNDDHR